MPHDKVMQRDRALRHRGRARRSRRGRAPDRAPPSPETEVFVPVASPGRRGGPERPAGSTRRWLRASSPTGHSGLSARPRQRSLEVVNLLSRKDPSHGHPGPTPTEPQPSPRPRRLTRSTDDRALGGVAGGLGAYFDVDPVLFRIAAVALVVFGGAGLLLYVAAWVLIPNDQTARGLRPARPLHLETAAPPGRLCSACSSPPASSSSPASCSPASAEAGRRRDDPRRRPRAGRRRGSRLGRALADPPRARADRPGRRRGRRQRRPARRLRRPDVPPGIRRRRPPAVPDRRRPARRRPARHEAAGRRPAAQGPRRRRRGDRARPAQRVRDHDRTGRRGQARVVRPRLRRRRRRLGRHAAGGLPARRGSGSTPTSGSAAWPSPTA